VYSQENKEESKADKKVEVPEIVKKAFAKNYPNVTKVEWSIAKKGEYEAEFDLNKTEMSVIIDNNGTILETESEIKEADLPQAIKATLAKDYADYKINEITKTDAKGVVTYEMEAKPKKKEFELVFDNNGKLLKQEEEKGDKEDKD
jgi:hypothetical protein